MLRERDYAQLHAAAYHFARFSRKSAEIAQSIGVTDKTIREFRKDSEWDRSLDIFGYTGIREFERAPRRDIARDNADTYNQAREIYTQLLTENTPKHKIASLTAKAVSPEQEPRTIRRWAKQGNWHIT